jgi:hypothetical protein
MFGLQHHDAEIRALEFTAVRPTQTRSCVNDNPGKRDHARRVLVEILYKGACFAPDNNSFGRSASEHICIKKKSKKIEPGSNSRKSSHDDMSFKVIFGVFICGIYLCSG